MRIFLSVLHPLIGLGPVCCVPACMCVFMHVVCVCVSLSVCLSVFLLSSGLFVCLFVCLFFVFLVNMYSVDNPKEMLVHCG